MRISDWSSDVCSSDLVVEPTTWQALPAMLLVERSGFGLNELLGAKPGAVSHELLTCEKRQAAIQAPAEQRRQPDNWAGAIVEVNRVDVNPKRGKHGKSNQCAKPELANVPQKPSSHKEKHHLQTNPTPVLRAVRSQQHHMQECADHQRRRNKICDYPESSRGT